MNSPVGRKIRTEKVVKALGIPVNKNLPPIHRDEEHQTRTIEAIIDRAIANTIVSAKGSGAPDEVIDELIDRYYKEGLFTPYELEFLENEDPDQDELNAYSWKIECNSALLWAVSLVRDLPFPNELSDVQKLYDLIFQSERNELLSQAQFRDYNILMDELDLYYRLHWALVETRLHNQELAVSINPGVVYERRYGLTWLLNLAGEEWEDISMDT